MCSSAAAASVLVQRVLESDGQLIDTIQLRVKQSRPSRGMIAAAIAMARDAALVPMALGLNSGSQTRAVDLKIHILCEGLLSSTAGSSASGITVKAASPPQPTLSTLPDAAAAIAAGWCCPPPEAPLLSTTPQPPKNGKMYYVPSRGYNDGTLFYETYNPVSCVWATAPTPGDGYGPPDQLHIQPTWISRNTPGVAKLAKTRESVPSTILAMDHLVR